MAIQTQMYPDNLGLSFGAASQDYCFMDNNIYHNSNNTLNNNLCNGLVFNLQQKQQQQQHECVHERSSKNFPHGFADYLDKYNQEIDQYIILQSDRLKAALQEEAKKQMGGVWRKLQVKGMITMQQRNDEIAKATEKRRALEESLAKMEEEKDAWKRMAAENESMVISLNNAFEQVRQQNTNMVADDGESWSDERTEMKCRVCKDGEASVVLLPCRHLCCCVGCHSCVDVCPVCHSIKKASIQALFS